ncbi:glycosyltransferase [Rhodococcus sp. 077-4]|uniref:glycosyltransferase n=1 Tax=Rhodococcus sp. 077-4 TaxID=2789271 RepID=UPI0039F57192
MIRVASVPSSHAYVQHLQPVLGNAEPAGSADESVVLLPDPAPAHVDVPGQWWPPRLLDSRWLAEQTDVRFDVLHVHFGFESFEPEELTRTVAHLRAHRQPMVLTVHDLHNPHFADNADHLRKLDVLVCAADAVITLTRGAADWIRDRWGVEATVVEHPHVVPLERMDIPRPQSDSFVIGVHAKNLRSNMDPLAVMDAVVEAARSLPDASVRLDIDEDVFEFSSHWYNPTVGAKLLDYNSFPDVDVRVHGRFDDDALWDYLASIDVAVLPYRFGTHSGWLEACRDLGTSVVASDCGFHADQAKVHTFRMGIDSFDPATLVSAVRASYDDRTQAMDSSTRAEQRRLIAATHAAIYSEVLKKAR